MAKWGNISSRGNVEDRRAVGPVAVGGLSLTGFALMLVVTYLTGGDLGDVFGQLQAVPVERIQQLDRGAFVGKDDYEVFASTVLGSTTDTWTKVFAAQNQTYIPPTLVLFRTATQSQCGTATSQVGPHYCPLDQTIYLDETFFDELTSQLGATGGDVAESYVIAHEVGHHVQQLVGSLEQDQRSNEDSIALELQADCFAGIWANSIRELGVFEPGEIREAMDAASAVGDDRIQESVIGYTNPESWTHGSSQQRVSAFTRGYESGDPTSCSLEL